MDLYGEHAIFIWTAYGVTLLVLGWTGLAPVWRRRRMEKSARRQIAGISGKGAS